MSSYITFLRNHSHHFYLLDDKTSEENMFPYIKEHTWARLSET